MLPSECTTTLQVWWSYTRTARGLASWCGGTSSCSRRQRQCRSSVPSRRRRNSASSRRVSSPWRWCQCFVWHGFSLAMAIWRLAVATRSMLETSLQVAVVASGPLWFLSNQDPMDQWMEHATSMRGHGLCASMSVDWGDSLKVDKIIFIRHWFDQQWTYVALLLFIKLDYYRFICFFNSKILHIFQGLISNHSWWRLQSNIICGTFTMQSWVYLQVDKLFLWPPAALS